MRCIDSQRCLFQCRCSDCKPVTDNIHFMHDKLYISSKQRKNKKKGKKYNYGNIIHVDYMKSSQETDFLDHLSQFVILPL